MTTEKAKIPFTEMIEIVAKYGDKKCNNCQRELKIGWHIWYDGNNKVAYCQPCHAKMNLPVPPPTTISPDKSKILSLAQQKVIETLQEQPELIPVKKITI